MILGCKDGDVKLTRGNVPQIYYDRKWMNICPFQFIDGKYGIEKFCAKFGLHLGGTQRRATDLEEKYHKKVKYYESYGDASNERCLFASDRQILVAKKVPEDTIGRFMRSREALPIDDIIKICKEVYSRKYLKLLDILVEIF